MEIKLNLRQAQSLSPQMIQAAKVLQMGVMDLREHLQQQFLENPALESEERFQPEDEKNSELSEKLEWLCSGDYQNRSYYQDDIHDISEWASNGSNSEESLYDHLRAQIHFEQLPTSLRNSVECVLQSLNSNGMLDEPVADLAVHAETDEETILQAITLVQSLEPAGVAARSLSECLVLQLQRLGETGLALVIARDHLDEMGRNHYNQIAQKTGSSQEKVRAACQLIRSMNPRPGASFTAGETTKYLVPDLTVTAIGDGYEILSNDTFIPSLRVSAYYSSLMLSSDDAETRDYLTTKVRQARWVLQAVEQRRSTLLACAKRVVARQDTFFRFGPGHLRPMSLADIAADTGVHESTVSRAIQDKYLQCDHGVFPLKHFFTRALSPANGAEDISAERAKAVIHILIQQENRKAPLSDQKLSQLLARQGIQISRRTAAKYRNELGIPPAVGRKKL